MKDIFLALVGVAAAVLSVSAPYYADTTLRAYSQFFFWGGLVVAALCLLLALTLKKRPLALKSRIKLPTLEATRNSTIDATGAIIPGDLPFQFAKADDHSLIAMAGIKVTRNEDGTILVNPDAEPIKFPPPTGEFSMFSNQDLKFHCGKLSTDLRCLQKLLYEETARIRADKETKIAEEEIGKVVGRYAAEYKRGIAREAHSVASELLSRLMSATFTTASAANGGRVVYYKTFCGPTPASDAADFLDELARQLRI